MTVRTTVANHRALPAAAVALAVVAALLGAVATAPDAEARRGPDDVITKTIKLSWQGKTDKSNYTSSGRVPGIGQLKLVCKPKSTMLKIKPDDRNRETTMWLAKYEKKNDNDVVAVKNVRVYRYDTADDDGTGGTGKAAHEGLNQLTPIETFASGYAEGVISTRTGRHLPGGAQSAVPATSIKFSWWWENFREPRRYRSCSMKAELTTDPTQSTVLTWHGDQDTDGVDDDEDRTVVTSDLSPLGTLELTCQTGRRSIQWLRLITDDPNASLRARTITAEGLLDDHVEEDYMEAGGGYVGPLDMPENGMMELNLTANGRTVNMYLSSYYITNDDENPELNLCEVAAAPF